MSVELCSKNEQNTPKPGPDLVNRTAEEENKMTDVSMLNTANRGNDLEVK